MLLAAVPEQLGLLARLYELERKLASIDRVLGEIVEEIAELRDAKKAIQEYRVRRAYRFYGKRLLIEVDPAKLLESIDEEIGVLEAKAARLEAERKKIIEEIEKLRSQIPGLRTVL